MPIDINDINLNNEPGGGFGYGAYGNPPNPNNPSSGNQIPDWWSCDRCYWMPADQVNNDQVILDLILPDYIYSNTSIGGIVYHDLHFYEHTEFGTWYKLTIGLIRRVDLAWEVWRVAIVETNNPTGICVFPATNNGGNNNNDPTDPGTPNPPKSKITLVNTTTGNIQTLNPDPPNDPLTPGGSSGPTKPTLTVLLDSPKFSVDVDGVLKITKGPTLGPGIGVIGSNAGDSDPCMKFAHDPQLYQQCACIHSNNSLPGCVPKVNPPNIGPKPILPPPCPTPGHGGEFDPFSITGNDGIVLGGFAQSSTDSWQGTVMVDWGPVSTLVDVDNAIINLQGNHLINTSFGIREALEKQLDISFTKDVAFNECAPNLQPKSNIFGVRYLHGFLTLRYPGPGYDLTLTIRTYKKIGDPINEYVIGDLSSDKFLYRIGGPRPKIITPPPPVSPPPSGPPVSPPPGQPPVIPGGQGPIIPIKPVDPPIPSGKIFSNLEPPLIERVETTYGIWSENIGNLTTMYTCSIAHSASNAWKRSHYTIFNKPCTHRCAEQQYEVTYGHDEGSGSIDLGGFDHESPTNAIYSQYRLLCLNPNQKRFNINGKESKHVYIINIKQSRMGDRFDEGNWELNLHHLSGSQHLQTKPINSFTGSAVKLGTPGQILRLIDDSKLFVYSSSFGGHYYNVVSGSIEDGIFNKEQPQIFGQVYPSLGIIVLDADKLDQSASFGTSQATDKHCDNAYKLVLAMSASTQYTDRSGDQLGFQARRVKINYDRYYFIRVKNAEYNYSNNPTYVTGSEGMIKPEFVNNQTVFISSIGFYDASGNLVAVGKVSKPIVKSRTEEALFTVRLRY